MSGTPTGPESQFAQCAKCGARNPGGVTECLGCGQALPVAAREQRPMPLRYRLLISALIGLVVFAISGEVAYQQYCHSAVGYDQSLTLRDIDKAVKAIEEYRQKNGALPNTLDPVASGFIRRDENGMPVDHWRRPLHYSTDGSRFRIVSYGQDGKPGGIGLDYDLSSDDVPKGGLSEAGSGPPILPPRARPTFRQFATYDVHENSGSGRMMFLMTILTAVVAFALSLREVGKPMSDREAPVSRWFRLLIAILGTLLIATMYIIPLHVPSGH